MNCSMKWDHSLNYPQKGFLTWTCSDGRPFQKVLQPLKSSNSQNLNTLKHPVCSCDVYNHREVTA
jgi:hypothetical protein